jgi:hypothetical protein
MFWSSQLFGGLECSVYQFSSAYTFASASFDLTGKSYANHSTRPLYARLYHLDIQDLQVGVELHYCLQSERSIFRWDKVWRLLDNHYGHDDVSLFLVHFQSKGWLHCILNHIA